MTAIHVWALFHVIGIGLFSAGIPLLATVIIDQLVEWEGRQGYTDIPRLVLGWMVTRTMSLGLGAGLTGALMALASVGVY